MPPRASFLLRDEQGGLKSWELWRYAKALGVNPRRALNDPDLAFGLSVMRGHDRFRRELFRRSAEAVSKKDTLGINRIYQALRLIFEDS